MLVWAVVCASAGLAPAAQAREPGGEQDSERADGPAPRDPAAAEVLFQEGRRLLKAGDVLGASGKLEESLRLDPAVGTLANLADCEETLGRTASAWQHWRQAADQMSTGDRRRKPALARAARLEKILPRLQVTVAPEVIGPIAIERDGVRLGDASLGLSLPVDPGHHVVIVSAPERQPRRFDVVLIEKETTSLVVAPGPPAIPAPAPAPPAVAPVPAEAAPPAPPVHLTAAPRAPEATPLLRRLRPADWIVLGVGAAGAGAAALFGVQALAAREDAADLCPRQAGLTRCWSTAQQPLARDRRSSLLADLGLVAGVAAAGAATYLLTRPRAAQADAAPRLLAGPLRGGGEVQVVGSF